MKERELETHKSPNAWFASHDARMRNIANASHYTERQKIAAERMKQTLALLYWYKDIHINYRQKFITVKVDEAKIKDRKNLALIEDEYEQLGYTKAVSNQGVIYRIPKV